MILRYRNEQNHTTKLHVYVNLYIFFYFVQRLDGTEQQQHNDNEFNIKKETQKKLEKQ